MFFVKKFLPLLLFFASLTNSATHDTKQEFLRLYYTGKYEEAHAYDTATRSGWEARLHVHERFSGCKFESDASSRGIAMLRIGMIDQAIGHFGQDWLSFLGRAKLAGWNNEIEIGREFIRKAIQLKPEQPDLYFYAALYARTDEEALNYFERYLKTHPPDTSKRSSARQAIEFFAKTKGIRLNHANLASPVERIDSNFDHRRLTFRAKIDNKPDVVLLMDTGAAGLSLKDKSWRARNTTDFLMIGLGTKQQTRASLMVFNEFSSGGFRIKNPVAAVTRNLQSAGIDGIAGTIIFSDYKIVLPSRKDSQVMFINNKRRFLFIRSAR
jgi:tetratricopeptide (TPR) repeat protein